MAVLSKNEQAFFLDLFIENGRVLGFSRKDLDKFARASVGSSIMMDGQPMGKSLEKYADSESAENVTELMFDLFDYYETHCLEKNTDREKKKLYERCKEIIRERRNNSDYLLESTRKIKEEFSSEYINKQINRMMLSILDNPTDAIGKAKELIESCCKTIIDKSSQKRNPYWKLEQLLDKTMDTIVIVRDGITEKDKADTKLKETLKSIALLITDLRNFYGSGHGKTAEFKGLEERHARLAVAVSQALVTFLWDTFQEGKEK